MAAALSPDEIESRIQGAVERLAEEFSGTFSRETIMRCAVESRLALHGARVTEFLPVFVYRFTRERLKARAQVGGLMQKQAPEILFVCVHNAGRSQMAAVFAQHLGGGRLHVRSAGYEPAGVVNPHVVEALAEVGLDLSREFPKPLTDDIVEAADMVVTMGCGDACPVYPGKRYIDWQVDDPAGQPIEVVRRIRDDIRALVENLLGELGVAPTTTGA